MKMMIPCSLQSVAAPFVLFACLTMPVFTPATAAVFSVVNTNNAGAGSLRAAIESVQTSTPPNEIHFNIPGPGPHTIRVSNVLPFITNSVSILGDTQPGYTGTPLVTLLGPTVDFFDVGLDLRGPSTLVRGLRFSGFTQLDFGAGINMYGNAKAAACVFDGNFNGIVAQGGEVGGTTTNDRNIIINNVNGIWMVTGSTAVVRGNFIGVQADGVTPAGNENGIRTFYTSGRTIEGHPNYPQVISGNTNAGILLGPNGGYVFFSSGNTIRGNHIGTDLTGTIAVPNKFGIHSWGGAANIIGGTSTNHRNIIAGNSGTGVLLEGLWLVTPSAYNNQVLGNYIGLAADGMTPLPNDIGVHILNGMSNVVGGTSAGQANRFGESEFHQVYVSSSGVVPCYNNSVLGNWIGVTTGNTVIAGGQTGVYINNASNNVIGGVTSTARNIIGGAGTGIYITGTNAQYNRVVGNLIGCGPVGELFPNDNYGVNIYQASRNTIGGNYTNEANTISGNLFYGVLIQGTGSFHNVVAGNLIGTDPTGTYSVSNRYSGVSISDGAFSNEVGGTTFTRGNVIAGNGNSGVVIRDEETHANTISYNYIGMNRSLAPVTNGYAGIEIFQASSNFIGIANIIGNSRGTAGIQVHGTNATGNILTGNFIGMDNSGTAHPNSIGVDVLDARNTVVGLPVLFGGNFIAGNKSQGIMVRGEASNTVIRSNLVGTDFTGTIGITNLNEGIVVDAPYTTVGGTTGGNLISANRFNGIRIGIGGSHAVVQGNLIGVDNSGNVALPNLGNGIRIQGSDALIGGPTPDARNIIAGNTAWGVVIDGGSNATVMGNYIGTGLNGSTRVANNVGMLIGVDGATIGGTGTLANVISGNTSFGIDVTNGTNIRIVGNLIGLAADGVTTNANNSGGVRLRLTANGVTLGGTNDHEANVIARNGGTTEVTVDGPSGGHLIQRNFVGVQRFGVAFPSHESGRGISLNQSPNNQILGNIIGQVNEALYLNGTGTFATVIKGNFIGEYNLEPLTNSSWGVTITNARNTVLGGFTTEERNLITRNNGGVLVTGTNAINNDVARNLIYGNSARLNIDLGPLGFNNDDVNDPDPGANLLQNRPRLTNAITVSPSSFVYAQGVLTSAPSTTYAIDLFRSQGTNASAFRYLGRTFTTTDAGGVGFFSAGLLINLVAGEYLSATATDPNGNTSELAASPFGAVATTTADTDNDGIPSYWEILYGLNPSVSNAPDADADGDGTPDVQEFIADTAANNSNAFPVITWIDSETNRLVSFPSSSVRVYSLHANAALTTGAWTQVGNSVTGLHGETTMTDTNQSDWMNYRTAVRLP